MKLIFSVSFIIISIFLFFVVVNPLYKDVSSLKDDVAGYNVALNHSNDLHKTLVSLSTSYNDIKPGDRIRLEHFLPNTSNNIRFILEIEQMANLHNMPIKDIKFATPKPEVSGQPATGGETAPTNDPNNDLSNLKPYGVFPIEFTTEGNYNDFTLFLKDVEHNLRLTDIKSISFEVPSPETKGPTGANINPNIYTYNLEVETYWLK